MLGNTERWDDQRSSWKPAEVSITQTDGSFHFTQIKEPGSLCSVLDPFLFHKANLEGLDYPLLPQMAAWDIPCRKQTVVFVSHCIFAFLSLLPSHFEWLWHHHWSYLFNRFDEPGSDSWMGCYLIEGSVVRSLSPPVHMLKWLWQDTEPQIAPSMQSSGVLQRHHHQMREMDTWEALSISGQKVQFIYSSRTGFLPNVAVLIFVNQDFHPRETFI